jgi:hypothetical protein
MAFYFLELYSGHGSVSSIASKVLGIPSITVDIDEARRPTICLDITMWNTQTTTRLRNMFPGRRPIIWASPPCTEYSRVKAVPYKQRDFEQADSCVSIVDTIATELDSALTLLENPATGYLVGRHVVDFLPHRVEVDYCQYGCAVGMRKRTSIWSSHALYTFEPKLCPGYPGCQSMLLNETTGMPVHACTWHKTSRDQRIAIPTQLATMLMRSVKDVLRTTAVAQIICEPNDKTKTRRTKDHNEVDYIEDAGIRKDKLYLLVAWVGYDKSTWIEADKLDAPLEEYCFLDEDVLDVTQKLKAQLRNDAKRNAPRKKARKMSLKAYDDTLEQTTKEIETKIEVKDGDKCLDIAYYESHTAYYQQHTAMLRLLADAKHALTPELLSKAIDKITPPTHLM